MVHFHKVKRCVRSSQDKNHNVPHPDKSLFLFRSQPLTLELSGITCSVNSTTIGLCHSGKKQFSVELSCEEGASSLASLIIVVVNSYWLTSSSHLPAESLAIW